MRTHEGDPGNSPRGLSDGGMEFEEVSADAGVRDYELFSSEDIYEQASAPELKAYDQLTSALQTAWAAKKAAENDSGYTAGFEPSAAEEAYTTIGEQVGHAQQAITEYRNNSQQAGISVSFHPCREGKIDRGEQRTAELVGISDFGLDTGYEDNAGYISGDLIGTVIDPGGKKHTVGVYQQIPQIRRWMSYNAAGEDHGRG